MNLGINRGYGWAIRFSLGKYPSMGVLLNGYWYTFFRSTKSGRWKFEAYTNAWRKTKRPINK